MRQRIRAQAGFSLIELMIAIVLLAVGLLSLAQLQVTAMQTNTHSAGMIGANTLAQQVAEEIMSFPAEIADPDKPRVTTTGGGDFLRTAVNNAPFLYLRGGVASPNYANWTGGGATGGAGNSNYQVTYTAVPDYTNRGVAAGNHLVCRIDIRVRDLSETRFRNFVDVTLYKNWIVP